MEEDPSEDSGFANSVSESFKCPKCHQIFKHLKGLRKHIAYICKAEPPDILVLDFPRIPHVPVVPVTKVTHSKELNGLLSTVESSYVRWRLSQALGVTHSDTYPILFNYRYRFSKSSVVSRCCQTSQPYEAMYNVLIDAKQNHQVGKI